MIYRFILSCTAVLMLTACSNRENSAETVDADMAVIDSIETEARLEQELQKRIDADPKLAKLREASLKLSEYVRLDGDIYVLDITEEEAVKIGVDTEAYNYHLNEITKANEIIAETKAKGDSIKLIDPQKILKEYKNKK